MSALYTLRSIKLLIFFYRAVARDLKTAVYAVVSVVDRKIASSKYAELGPGFA